MIFSPFFFVSLNLSSQKLLMIWMALPFLVGFGLYLLPKALPVGVKRQLPSFWSGIVSNGLALSDRLLSLGIALASLVYGLSRLFNPEPLALQLLDQFGVSLLVDSFSGYLIVTNALVTAAVILYCWNKGKGAFFYTQVTILLGSVNAVFICADFMSLYVALEVISVAAFLLMAYPRTNRSIWVGLRYLLVSNTVMLFYLVGTALVYQHNQSFNFAGLANAPTEAIALIFLGLLTKGGIFVSGLWLPLTHAESDTPVSALLSGVVITTGVFPLVRCALLVETVLPILTVFSAATAILGVIYAIIEPDTKRTLAASTISQLGFVLANPPVAGMYALTHGLAKASLFLIAGNLPSRKFRELRQQPIPITLWFVLAIASLSICGFPLLAGFEAKVITLKTLTGWQGITLNIVSVGTAIAFAKFIFLPFTGSLVQSDIVKGNNDKTANEEKESDARNGQMRSPALRPSLGLSLAPYPESSPIVSNSTFTQPQSNVGLWLAMLLLLDSLLAFNTLYYQAYSPTTVIKSLITIAVGWLLYIIATKVMAPSTPRSTSPSVPQRHFPPAPQPVGMPLTLWRQQAERIEHLIGGMSLVLTLLFWMVLV